METQVQRRLDACARAHGYPDYQAMGRDLSTEEGWGIIQTWLQSQVEAFWQSVHPGVPRDLILERHGEEFTAWLNESHREEVSL